MPKTWAAQARDHDRARRQNRSARVAIFDAPGKATLWGMAGCVLCAVYPQGGFKWAAIFTVITALAGCFNP